MPLTLASADFPTGDKIPALHTCTGADLSPELHWSGAPPGTKSFALVVTDPDAPDPAAPKMTWTHWVLYALPATTTQLERGMKRHALPAGAREGKNDWKTPGWRGPCPPIGRHRYFFRLYALDEVTMDLNVPDRARLEQVITGHVLAVAELFGTFEKPVATHK
jgi:Raf kinase inhibitor-like YbhB/YbcL family protein